MNIFETEFAAYISAKKSGQRKEAMKALNAFLEDCKKLDLDAEPAHLKSQGSFVIVCKNISYREMPL